MKVKKGMSNFARMRWRIFSWVVFIAVVLATIALYPFLRAFDWYMDRVRERDLFDSNKKT